MISGIAQGLKGDLVPFLNKSDVIAQLIVCLKVCFVFTCVHACVPTCMCECVRVCACTCVHVTSGMLQPMGGARLQFHVEFIHLFLLDQLYENDPMEYTIGKKAYTMFPTPLPHSADTCGHDKYGDMYFNMIVICCDILQLTLVKECVLKYCW